MKRLPPISTTLMSAAAADVYKRQEEKIHAMGSAPNVYELLRKELQGTDAKVLTPESEGYAESIKRWSEHLSLIHISEPRTSQELVCRLLLEKKQSIAYHSLQHTD